MLRVSARLVDLDTAQRYCVGEAVDGHCAPLVTGQASSRPSNTR
jgi:hypothetical protein